MRRWLPRVLLGGLIVIVLAVVGTYWYVRPLLLTATGYAAHNACALAHVSGRADVATDLPPNPLVPYLRAGVDADGASASILGALAGQRAWYTPGFGCTLAAQRPQLPAPAPVAAGAELPSVPESPAVTAALAHAFGDDLTPEARAELGTRAVVVLHRGQVVGERYAPGFDASTPQLGWSMSKSVTNLVAGRLVAQGALSLQDAALAPQLTGEKASITVDDLLRMSSGIQWDETYDLGTPITRMLYLEPDMASYVASLPLAHRPGTYQQYATGSTNLLCSVMSDRTRAGANLPRTELLAPLGLAHATFETDAAGDVVCGSYLWATPREWAAIGQFALDDGVWNGERLLPENWMSRSTTVSGVDATEEAGYAAGWWANQMPGGRLVVPTLPADTYWASGHDGQWIYIVPSSDLVVVRLGFSPTLSGEPLRANSAVARLIDAVR